MIIVKDKNIESVSIPAISTGIFGYPLKKAAKVICNTVKNFIKDNPSFRDKTIVFCNFDDDTVSIKQL